MDSRLKRAPLLFVSHGSPFFALERSQTTQRLNHAGESLRDANAILILSAHWCTPSLEIIASDEPGVLYDFHGFPQSLYSLKPEITNDAMLVESIAQDLSNHGHTATLNTTRGYDHGVWVPMLHLLPYVLPRTNNANESQNEEKRPAIIQLSLPWYTNAQGECDLAAYFHLGQAVKSLREQGIAIVGSGSLTHNLRKMRPTHLDGGVADNVEAVDKSVVTFERWVQKNIEQRCWQALIDAPSAYPGFSSHHPTLEHYLPLLFVLGAIHEEDLSHLLANEIAMWAISMHSYLFE